MYVISVLQVLLVLLLVMSNQQLHLPPVSSSSNELHNYEFRLKKCTCVHYSQ